MATPTDYIFTPGTCLKKDFYGVLKTALTNAGWTNVTSNYNTDGDVFVSTLIADGKALNINLKNTEPSIIPSNHTQDTDTTLYTIISVRSPEQYTPGTDGSAGVFTGLTTWVGLQIAPQPTKVSNNPPITYATPIDTILNYKIYVDTSKVIVSIEYQYCIDPEGASTDPMLFYIGVPDTVYNTKSNNDLIIGTTAGAVGLRVTNTSDGIGKTTDSYVLDTMATTPTKNPNNNGSYATSEIYYGSLKEGVRGKLDGILTLSSSNLRTGTMLKIGSYMYYVLTCKNRGWWRGYTVNSFPSNALAIRIS